MRLSDMSRKRLRHLLKQERRTTSLLKGIIDARIFFNLKRVRMLTLAPRGIEIPREVPAIIYGHFAIDRRYSSFFVSHVGCGMMVGMCESLIDAIFFCGACEACGVDWEAIQSEEDARKLKDDAHYLACMERVKAAHKRANGWNL